MKFDYFPTESVVTRIYAETRRAEAQHRVLRAVDLTPEEMEELRAELRCQPLSVPAVLHGVILTVDGMSADEYQEVLIGRMRWVSAGTTARAIINRITKDLN